MELQKKKFFLYDDGDVDRRRRDGVRRRKSTFRHQNLITENTFPSHLTQLIIVRWYFYNNGRNRIFHLHSFTPPL